MRFAIISDIHGNLPALDAVLEDAEENGADSYIFVGDYCLSNPYPNECITRIRELNNKYVIRGNEERYLENLVGKDQSTWTDGQMQISYWNYQNISRDNLEYILSLPTRLSLLIGDVTLQIAHSSEEFIGDAEGRIFGPAKVAKRYQDRLITSETFGGDIRKCLVEDAAFRNAWEVLADGVYIFGHTHLQWSYQSKDGRKVLLNPGSCGLPLDCVEGGMPYTLLDISDMGDITVEERRVPFDRKAYLECFRESDQFAKANVWSKVILKELKTAREHLTFFLQNVEKYAVEIGDNQRPFSVPTWEQGFARWQESCRECDFAEELP